MVEVVHLGPGERAPKGTLLIECRRGLRGEELIQDARGVTLRIRPEDLDETLAKLPANTPTVYVKGVANA